MSRYFSLTSKLIYISFITILTILPFQHIFAGQAPVNIALGSTVSSSTSTMNGSLSYLVDGVTLDQTNTSRWRGAAPNTIDVDFGTPQNIASAVISTGYFNGTFFDSQVASFSLQYWNGSSFVNISGASITGNINSQVTFIFSTISTQKVRLVTQATSDTFARYMEIQVWTPDTRPPTTVPGVPTITSVTSGDSQAIISFNSPSDGGTPITSYTVKSNPGNNTKTTSSSPIYVTGLTNGTAYTFTVFATNSVGNSAISAASGLVVPVSQRVLVSPVTQLLSICQSTKTDLHMLSSVDSMKYSAGTNQIIIYKKNSITYSYNFTAIDSIGILNGSKWQDSLKVAYDVTRYGLLGDGTSNNRTNLVNAISAANSASANLYFPNGTYYINGGLNTTNVRFIGQSKNNTILKETTLTNEHNLNGAENITFQDFYVSDYGTSTSRVFKNCVFNTSASAPGSYIQVYSGVYVYGASEQFIDCDFNFSQIWIPLFLRKYNSVLVQNCYFNGHATHNIRLQEPNIKNAQVNILNNTIFGGTTGIFLTSSKSMPLVGGLIQGNKLYTQDEESIAMDGFGNDAGMIPVIANGQLSSASNDTSGRLVIGMAKMLSSDSTLINVSSRTDWKNFYFAFGAGTGLDGKYVKVYDYNASANTLTVDTIVSSSNIILTGDCGVESGFFNWSIIGNSVSGTLGTNNTYGTAISAYLNVFGMNIQNNVVTNCAHGINVAGGNMIKNTRTLAFNNLVQNNYFIDCDRYSAGQPTEDLAAIRFISYFSATGPLQFNNKFINNTVNGGRLLIERQRNFVETGNIYNNVIRLSIDVQ